MGRYARLGEAVGVICGTAVAAGLLCLVLSAVAPGGYAWVFLWASLVAAAAWFQVADRKRWSLGVMVGGQIGIIGTGLAVSLSLIAGSGWVLLLSLVIAGPPVVLLMDMQDESPPRS